MNTPHGALAGAARVAAIAAALVIAGLLLTIKADLAAIGAALVQRDAEPQTTITQESSMISFQKSWESAECGTVTILTVCGIDYNGNPIPGGETLAQCIARHRAAVAQAMAECPPV